MTGSILDVLTACAMATGRSFTPPIRGRLTMCPYHVNKKTPALSISEEKGLFHCHGCGVKGGLLDAVIAFDLASNRTESSRWLA